MKLPKKPPRPYTQCKLCKGNAQEMVYIPKKFAKKDNVLKIKRNGVWDDHWVVTEVHGEVDETVLDGIRRLWKKHRQHTDVVKGTFKKPEGEEE